jgi:hypothetical protein
MRSVPHAVAVLGLNAKPASRLRENDRQAPGSTAELRRLLCGLWRNAEPLFVAGPARMDLDDRAVVFKIWMIGTRLPGACD